MPAHVSGTMHATITSPASTAHPSAATFPPTELPAAAAPMAPSLALSPEKRYIPPAAVKSSWMGKPLLQITAHHLGEEYLLILELLCQLETAYGFKTSTVSFQGAGGKKAPPKPKELADWVKDGRGRRLKPEVYDATVMEKSWWSYWLAIQPEWRGSARPLATTPPSDLPPEPEHWGPLVAPGPNGMLGIVACLYWWGCTVKGVMVDKIKNSGTVPAWEAAVADVTYVLRGLLHAMSLPSS
ncbi:hypothetical protein HWV62_29124 [Athelia sp. TMB]|nr:hypothetical protein HWV62_29124 [Athelia sp. TMB]